MEVLHLSLKPTLRFHSLPIGYLVLDHPNIFQHHVLAHSYCQLYRQKWQIRLILKNHEQILEE